MKPILIVDYGMANLRSVQKAFERQGFAAEISGDPNRVAECQKLVLPGVGAFRDAIARLNESGLAEPQRLEQQRRHAGEEEENAEQRRHGAVRSRPGRDTGARDRRVTESARCDPDAAARA